MGDFKGAECLILSEFMVQSEKETKIVPKSEENGEKQNGSEQNGAKKKGRNKNRPAPMKFERKDKLCPTLNNVTEDKNPDECVFPNCQFQHDTEKYLASKLPDIKDECHVFKTFGYCENGLSCRFGQCHIKDNKFNMNNSENGITARSHEKNHLPKALKESLRKKKYEFNTDKLVDKFYREREEALKKDEPEPEAKRIKVQEGKIETNEAEVKKVDWKNKLYLAPLTTVGNLPFRRICKKYGADITCGEMAMTQQILQGHQPEWALVQRHDSEDVFGVQLCGSQPHQFGRVAKLIEDGHIDVDFVDLNLGCPIDLVYKRGMGSGLMARKKPLEIMIKSMTAIMNRPLTVKIRTGIYMDKRIAHNLAPNLFEWGADMVTLHGRSREQRYTKLADWDYIGDVVKAVSPNPIYGNGDLINFEDYNLFKEKSGVSGSMLARGALIKPWVFTEIKEQRHWDISAQERLQMIQDYVNYGLEHWGSDDKGVETTRRFLLEWLSFLHRYVPVGILKSPPQRMNERVPEFKGRNDLESLLASPYCNEWIKITEMFLGPVPDGFAFEAKHKAHGYK